MKKLMTLMLGMSFLLGTVSLFAQDKPADAPKTEKKAKKKRRRSPPLTPTRSNNRFHSLAKFFCRACARDSGLAMRDNFFRARATSVVGQPSYSPVLAGFQYSSGLPHE